MILNVVSVCGSQAVRVADVSGRVDKGNRGDNEVLGGHGAKDMDYMVMDF